VPVPVPDLLLWKIPEAYVAFLEWALAIQHRTSFRTEFPHSDAEGYAPRDEKRDHQKLSVRREREGGGGESGTGTGTGTFTGNRSGLDLSARWRNVLGLGSASAR